VNTVKLDPGRQLESIKSYNIQWIPNPTRRRVSLHETTIFKVLLGETLSVMSY